MLCEISYGMIWVTDKAVVTADIYRPKLNLPDNIQPKPTWSIIKMNYMVWSRICMEKNTQSKKYLHMKTFKNNRQL
jgi:hypothetical protein